MSSEATRYETYLKDSYNFTFGMIGGRKNNYNSPGHGKPSKKPRKPRKQGGTGHNNNHNGIDDDNDDDDDDEDDNNHHGQSQPPQQGVFQPAPGAYACAYAAPYPYQCPPPPPPYQNQVAVGGYHGDYHAPGYPGSFLPHQGGGYGNHGGGHMKDVGLVGAAMGVVSFGMFKLLRERRRHGGRH